jgi:hypothetical protein
MAMALQLEMLAAFDPVKLAALLQNLPEGALSP